jgi:hypothetical protein
MVTSYAMSKGTQVHGLAFPRKHKKLPIKSSYKSVSTAETINRIQPDSVKQRSSGSEVDKEKKYLEELKTKI